MAHKVLVAEDEPLVARMLAQALQKAGYVVDVVGDGDAARDRLRPGAYDALITDWMMPNLDGIEVVRFVRSQGDSCYVALMTELSIPAARAHAIKAGADEFFTKPVVPVQLLGALSSWLDRRAKGLIKPREKPTNATSSEHPVAQTDAWKQLVESTRLVLAETVQVAFETGAVPASRVDGVRLSLPLIDSEHLTELHLAIETTRESAAELAKVMLGEGDPSDTQTLKDIIGELANISAGCAKTSFAKEAFPFTLGLATASELTGPYALTNAASFRAGAIELVVRFGVRPRASISVAASELREGMVLAENAVADAGGLLLPTGTRLTTTAADRLRGALKNRMVRVCIPESTAVAA